MYKTIILESNEDQDKMTEAYRVLDNEELVIFLAYDSKSEKSKLIIETLKSLAEDELKNEFHFVFASENYYGDFDEYLSSGFVPNVTVVKGGNVVIQSLATKIRNSVDPAHTKDTSELFMDTINNLMSFFDNEIEEIDNDVKIEDVMAALADKQEWLDLIEKVRKKEK